MFQLFLWVNLFVLKALILFWLRILHPPFYARSNNCSLEERCIQSGAVVKDKIYVLYRAEDNSAVGIGTRVSRGAG